MNVYLTKQEFQVAMNNIVYNPQWKRVYAGGDLLDLIYEKVNHVKMDQFKIICNRLLGSSRSAPLVPDFEKALSDAGLRRVYKVTSTPEQSSSYQSGPTYHLTEDVWANDKYIFIRTDKPRFIIKSDSPENPLVKLDSEVRSDRLREANKYIEAGKYNEYLKLKTPTPSKVQGLKLVEFEAFKEAK